MLNKSLYDKIIEASDLINQRARKGSASYITVSKEYLDLISNRRKFRRKEKIYSIYGIE